MSEKHAAKIREARKAERQMCLDGDHEWVVDDAHFVPDNRWFTILLVCQRCIYLGQESPVVRLSVDVTTHNWDLMQEAHYEWKKEMEGDAK